LANPQRRTLLELRTDVRTNLDEATAAFWTDTQLNRFLTQAADEVWAEVKKVKADYFLVARGSTQGIITILGQPWDSSLMQITPGATAVVLPPDLSELKTIEVITPGYEYLTFTAMDMTAPEMRYLATLTENQTPTGFFFDVVAEHVLVVRPRSDTTLDLFINYVPISGIFESGSDTATKPAFTVDTDELMMPNPLYLAVEAMATWRAQYMDRDPGADRWLDMANKTIARWMGSHRRQIQDPEIVSGVFEN
jgi:hypothetical protein